MNNITVQLLDEQDKVVLESVTVSLMGDIPVILHLPNNSSGEDRYFILQPPDVLTIEGYRVATESSFYILPPL